MGEGSDKRKGKGVVGADDQDDSEEHIRRQPRFNWNIFEVELLLQICCDELRKTFTKSGSTSGVRSSWEKIAKTYNSRRPDQEPVQKSQIKNKVEHLKGKWRDWKKLVGKDTTGVGLDGSTGNIDASDEWWDKKIKEDPSFEFFRSGKFPIHLMPYMDELWGSTYASGSHRVTASGCPPTVVYDELNGSDDRYVIPSVQIMYSDAAADPMEFSATGAVSAGGTNPSDRPQQATEEQWKYWMDIGEKITPRPKMKPTVPSKKRGAADEVSPPTKKSRPSNPSPNQLLQQQWLEMTSMLATRYQKSEQNLERMREHLERPPAPAVTPTVMTVNEAVARLSVIEGLTLDEFSFSMGLIVEPANREVLQSLQDDNRVVAWIKHMFWARFQFK